MDNAEGLPPAHRTRKARSSMRQSTPQHALSPQESRRLQEALTARARDVGWPAEGREGRETDVGQSARRASDREGLHPFVGHVTLGPVGMILSSDVPRLARHCSDGSPLVDLGGDTGGVRADSEGWYAPATAHGRWRLGGKGTDQLGVATRSRRGGQRQHGHRLEQVGLALAVGAQE